MLWVLKRTVSMRPFFLAPQTYVKPNVYENICKFTLKNFIFLTYDASLFFMCAIFHPFWCNKFIILFLFNRLTFSKFGIWISNACKWQYVNFQVNGLAFQQKAIQNISLTLCLIETPFNTFANRADPDQAALVRAAWSEPTLFAYVNTVELQWLEQTWVHEK